MTCMYGHWQHLSSSSDVHVAMSLKSYKLSTCPNCYQSKLDCDQLSSPHEASLSPLWFSTYTSDKLLCAHLRQRYFASCCREHLFRSAAAHNISTCSIAALLGRSTAASDLQNWQRVEQIGVGLQQIMLQLCGKSSYQQVLPSNFQKLTQTPMCCRGHWRGPPLRKAPSGPQWAPLPRG